MNTADISIATITLARDEAEETLLRNSLEQLAKLSLPVFITDGGSGRGFLNFIKNIPHFVLSNSQKRGVWAQAKNSLFEAYQHNSPFIFYTEPDKLDFFNQLPGFIADNTTTDRTGIILASRSKAGFATFPLFQQMTETTINNCCAEIIGSSYDYTYGPFLLNRSIAPYLNLVEQDLGWGWRPFTFNVASRLGYNVQMHQKDYQCPEGQRQDSKTERVYRMKQLTQNVQGIVLSTTVDLNKVNMQQDPGSE